MWEMFLRPKAMPERRQGPPGVALCPIEVLLLPDRPQKLRLLFYPAALPLSTSTLNRVAGLIRTHRKTVGSRWRVLDPGTQALLTLAYLRKGETLRDLAAGFGVSAATAWRRTRETIRLLAARAPGIGAALPRARESGAAFVILDGTLIHINRNQIDRPFYSGKRKRHGMILQTIADARGNLLWISGAIRGSIHDTKAARRPNLPSSRACRPSTACSP